jgi:hypothetical protein
LTSVSIGAITAVDAIASGALSRCTSSVARFAQISAIEKDVRDTRADKRRRAARQARSRPPIDALKIFPKPVNYGKFDAHNRGTFALSIAAISRVAI